MSLTSSVSRLIPNSLCVTALLMTIVVNCFGQAARPERGVMPTGSYAISDIENINLTANTGNNIININSLSSYATLNVNGWFGDDRFYIGNRSYAANISGKVIVSGGAGANNQVLRNEVSDAGVRGDPEVADGIRVNAFTAGTLLEGNVVHDNADDGIDVDAPGTRLQGNTATDNGDLGIDAAAGVTDGGGNTASGNGNALQCRNVACP